MHSILNQNKNIQCNYKELNIKQRLLINERNSKKLKIKLLNNKKLCKSNSQIY